ncbi:MAG: TolC family protein [Bacteroidia bacterium]|nr:TolC family protein [Bacteroidia bacterium]
MRKISSILILMILPFAGRTQSRDSSYSFSLKQAIDFALIHQMDVVNATLDTKISDAQVNEVIGIGLPQVNGSFDVKDFVALPTSLIPGEFVGQPPGTYLPLKFGTRYNATAGLSASQILFDPSYLVGVQASKTIRELSRKNLNRTKIETAVAVMKAYYNYLVLTEMSRVVDANLVRVKKMLDDTRVLYANGFVEKLDVDRGQVNYNNVLSEKEKFNNTLSVSMTALKFQMGMAANASLSLTDTLAADKIAMDQLQADPSKRIEYSILKTQYQLQQYNLKRYRVGFYPSLIAYGDLSTSAQRDKFDIFDPDEGWYPTGIIGATLNIPIFDGRQKHYKIQQEKRALEKIQNQISNFENAVALESQSARTSLEDASHDFTIQQSNLTLSNEVYKTAKLKYDQGVGSNLEVLNAETSLKEAQANYYNAMYSVIVAKIDYDKALGNIIY